MHFIVSVVTYKLSITDTDDTTESRGAGANLRNEALVKENATISYQMLSTNN